MSFTWLISFKGSCAVIDFGSSTFQASLAQHSTLHVGRFLPIGLSLLAYWINGWLLTAHCVFEDIFWGLSKKSQATPSDNKATGSIFEFCYRDIPLFSTCGYWDGNKGIGTMHNTVGLAQSSRRGYSLCSVRLLYSGSYWVLCLTVF